MILAFALLALVDEFEAAADQIKFPADDVLAKWSAKDESYRKVIRMITDRRGWARAFETIQKKLGLGPGKIDIDVILHESDARRLADSNGQFGFGKVRFNLKLLGPHQKNLDEIDADVRAGKISKDIVPTQRLEGLITHELTHVLSGGGPDLWVAEGLATYAAGEDYFLYDYNRRGIPIEPIDRVVREPDSYPRGLSFFRWVEKEHGQDKVREFAVRVASGTEATSTVAVDVLGKSWPQIVLREKTWSTEYIASFKTAR